MGPAGVLGVEPMAALHIEIAIGASRYRLIRGPLFGDAPGWIADWEFVRWELGTIVASVRQQDVVALLADQADYADTPTEAVDTLLARNLSTGRLLLVQTGHARPATDPMPPASNLIPGVGPLVPLDPVVPVAPETSFFSVRLVGESGGSYAGSRIRATLPDGSERTGVLDGHSMWRADDIVPGNVRVEQLSELVLAKDIPPLDGFDPADANVRVAAQDDVFSGATGFEHTVVVEQPGPRCVRLVGMSFALNKGFLLPEAMEGIRLLAHMYNKLEDAELLVVGHTDTSGQSSRNRSLSLQRAESIIQFVTDDVEGWYAHYTTATDYSRRWGNAEDMAMLSVLPSPDEPHYGEHHEQHEFSAAVRRFQVAEGLTEDGDPGENTRKALIAAYMAIDGTTLPDGVTTTAHGCGQDFLAVPTDDDVVEPLNRRVEVFMFPDGVDPAPAGDTSKPGDPHYAQWNEAVVEERTFTPGQAGYGSLEVFTDIEEAEQVSAGVVFVLESTDGAYAQEHLPVDGRIVDGYTTLDFHDLPMGSFFTLKVRYASDNEFPLFEDVPYPELSAVGNRGVDELLDPFTGETIEA